MDRNIRLLLFIMSMFCYLMAAGALGRGLSGFMGTADYSPARMILAAILCFVAGRILQNLAAPGRGGRGR